MFGFRITARLLKTFLAMVVALSAASAAWGQTTGSLRVYVTDEDDLEVPGVEVTISSPNLIGGAQKKTTDAIGMVLFTQLISGTYEVRTFKEKYSSVTVKDVSVNVGQDTAQQIVLRAGQAAEEVDVVGRHAVNTEETGRTTVLDKNYLNKVPSGRSYQSAITMAAGVTGGAGGNPNMAGGASNENTYMLDGANITDPVTGTFSANFNFDAIQQIEIMLGGYEPEYGVSLGGVVNLVTESGTNNLEFQTGVYYQNGNWAPKFDQRLTADGAQLAPTDYDSTFQTWQVVGKISGPIVRDKAWFIISYQQDKSLIANSGIPQAQDFEGHYILAKVTVAPSTEHRFTAFFQADPTSIDNIYQSNPFTKAESQGRQAQGGAVGQARWQWFVSPNVNLDTAAVVQKTFIEGTGVPCTHDRTQAWSRCKPWENEGEIDFLSSGRLGINGAYDSVNETTYDFDDRWRVSASSKLQVLSVPDPLKMGTHDIKMGVTVDQLIHDRMVGYVGNAQYYDINDTAYDPQTFTNYYWYEITGPIKYRSTGNQFGAFIQDAWKPVSNLTVKYGVRADRVVMRNDLGEPSVQGLNFGPRFFAAWDPFGDQKTKVAGGYGRFNDSGRLDVAGFTSGSNFGAKLYVGEFFGGAGGGPLGGASPNTGFLPTTTGMADYSPYAIRNTAAEKLRLPRVDEVLLVMQREIIRDVAIGANFTGKFVRNSYEPDETNVIYDEDGSSVIGSRTGNPLTSLQRLRTPTLAKRDYYQFDVSLNKIESKRWAASLTYSYVASIGSSTRAESGSFLSDPQSQYNYGLMTTDIRHQVKGWAYWDIPNDPWTTTLGASVQYFSGQPLERLYLGDAAAASYNIRIRPRGVYFRYNPVWQLDLRVQQAIDTRKGQLVLFLEAQNVTNNRVSQNFQGTGFYLQNRLLSATRQLPLSLLLGLRYEF